MYPYHNRCLQRIRSGELLSIEQAPPDSEYAIILHFRTYPYRRPIRAHSLWRYTEVLKGVGIMSDKRK